MYDRFQKAVENTAFQSLNDDLKDFVMSKSLFYKLTFSQIQTFITIAIDLQMWELRIKDIWQDKNGRNESFEHLLKNYDDIKNSPKIYQSRGCAKQKLTNVVFSESKDGIGFGKCPVASDKTSCCNLLTLDVYEGCGFGCSYCSVQTFYGDNIKIDKDFAQKLLSIKLDPTKSYHIGTGQSSDSLMFGNKDGSLDTLIEFAAKNPNVILEFKSKSSNVKHLLNSKIPRNIICSFSLNPQIVIDNEEHFTASLSDRLEAANALAKKGVLVGFHFHPMIFFENWENEYTAIARELTQKFQSKSVALVSFGTLTFIKSVLKRIRLDAATSKILQMPLHETHGKYSYPAHMKELMFKTIYNAFEAWHDKVFFYLCMEDKSLWQKTFGYDYANNATFEEDMKRAYTKKINALPKTC